MSKKRFIMTVLILVLLQIIINESLSISNYVFLAPLCFIIMGLERGVSSIKCMVLMFLTGLAVDILSSGIPGLWSASMTAASIPRLALIRRRAWADESGFYDMPSPEEIGTGVYIFYTLMVNLAFYVVYVIVEKMNPVLTLTDGIRITASVVANTLFMFLISLLVKEDKRY